MEDLSVKELSRAGGRPAREARATRRRLPASRPAPARQPPGASACGLRPAAVSAAGGSQPVNGGDAMETFGISTALISWMTPLDAWMFATVTFA